MTFDVIKVKNDVVEWIRDIFEKMEKTAMLLSEFQVA